MTKAETLLEVLSNSKKIPPAIKSKINSDLYPMGTKYHNQIPLGDILDILKKYGLIILQEDKERWSGMLLGRDSQATFDLGYLETGDEDGKYTVIDNTTFHLSWYKMESGRYEIVAYVG